VDAVSLAFATMNHAPVFFRKHADWATESEYRLVLLGRSFAPAYVDTRDALTGVALGESFADHRMPELRAAMAEYPNVQLVKLAYLNRRLLCVPASRPDAGSNEAGERRPSPAHRRPGDLDQRFADLLSALQEAGVLRAQGAVLADRHRSQIETVMSEVHADIETWSNINVRLHQSTTVSCQFHGHRGWGWSRPVSSSDLTPLGQIDRTATR
jgi:hypothetical protein